MLNKPKALNNTIFKVLFFQKSIFNRKLFLKILGDKVIFTVSNHILLAFITGF